MTDKTKVRAKKIPVSQPVNLTRTLVVCAPKIFSVTPPPKAAPSPSLLGRCIRITRIMSSVTIIQITRRRLIRIVIGDGEYGREMTNDKCRMTTLGRLRVCSFHAVPDFVQLSKIDIPEL